MQDKNKDTSGSIITRLPMQPTTWLLRPTDLVARQNAAQSSQPVICKKVQRQVKDFAHFLAAPRDDLVSS